MFGFNPIAKTTFAALGTIYASVVSESATYTDTSAAIYTGYSTVAETLTYSDAQTGAWGTGASVVETYTYSDTSAAIYTGYITVAETLTYSDAQTGAWNTKAYLNEIVYAQDFVAPQVNYVGNIPETTTLVDTTIPIGWYRINDNETAAWAAVNNNDNISWAQINDNQGTSWVPVNDNQQGITMASTFSPSLKLELMANGDQSGTWGTTTNTNLGTLLEQAIVGVQSIVMADADHTLTNFNGASDEARNAVLVVTGTNSAIRNIIAPSGQQKTYIISNGTAGGFAINIKAGAGGTPLAINSGLTEKIYTDGTNFYQVGMTSFNGGTTGLTPATPASGDVTLGGTLSVANGGTGVSNPNFGYVLLGNGTSALAGVAPGTSGYILTSNGTTWVSAPNGGGTVTSVSVVSANGLAGTVATATTTPAITLSTTVTGITKGNGTALSAATAGTDYSAGTSALGTGIVKTTTATGALTVAVAADFPTLNQNTTGTAGGLSGTALTGDVTSVGNATTIALGVAHTWTNTQTFTGSTSLKATQLINVAESVGIVAAAPATTQTFYVASGAVQYYTTAAANNWTINFAWSAGTSMNTAMAIGDSVTVAMLTTQGATAYYANAFQVDGVAVTPKWQGGTAPTAGNASGIDTYAFTIVKTASATYTIIGSMTEYK